MWKMILAFMVGMVLVGTCRTWAEAPANTTPITATGTLAKPDAALAKVAAVLGQSGVLFIRSQERWDQFKKLVPDMIMVPDPTPDMPLPKLDFSKQYVLLAYRTSCRPGDEFSLIPRFDLAANPPKIEFRYRWDNRPPADIEGPRQAKFILAMVPVTATIQADVSSVPIPPPPPPGVEQGQLRSTLEFSAILGDKAGGDVVDGLQAKITPKAATVKPGEDIQIDFELHLADLGQAKPEQFGTVVKSVYVWDAVYSEGYRNYGFFVTTPDGKTTFHQRKETKFTENAPYPVEITAEQPYLLSKDPVGYTTRSHEDLGIDTTAPGTFTLTAVYAEVGADRRVGKKEVSFWDGSIASNTITVEVKK